MAVMDYSQQQRVIDGTGRILDTTMTNPNTGSWVSEQQLKTWINTGMATDADLAAEVAQREADISDVKNALTAVDHRVQNLESAKGDYVPVDSDKGVITTPSGKGKWAVVEKLRGVSRAENQLVKGLYVRPETYGLTREATADGGIRIYGTCTLSTSFTVATMPSVTSGHSYLTSLGATLPAGCRISTSSDDKASSAVSISSTATSFGIDVTSGMTIDITMYPVARDLTLYFGSTVPTLAEIQTYYPWLLSPSDYGNSLVDSVYEGVVSVFKNLAQINSFTQSTSYGQTVPCNLRKGITYTVSGTASGGSTMRLLKSDGSYQYVAITATINATFVAEDDISEASFYGSLSVTNLQIEQGSSKTTFSEYHAPSTLSLPTPITLRSAGSVAEEFDLETGEKTNPISTEKNLATDYTWTLVEGEGFWVWRTTFSEGQLVPSSADAIRDCIAQNYVASSSSRIGFYDNEIAFSSSWLYVRTNSKSVQPSGSFWFALATPNVPTQLTPIQNPTILTEAGGTISAQTEEPIDGNFSVGFITL